MEKISNIKKALIFCSGADYDTLMQCSKSEINKFCIIGTTVLIPALLSIFTIGYAVWVITKNTTAVFFASLIWPIVIFIIERAFVANLKPGTFNFSVILRLTGAIVISFTISEVLLLGVFRDSIEQKLAQNLTSDVRSINQKYDQQLASIQNEISTAKSLLDAKERALLDEIDGLVVSGFGTGIKGYGPSATKKEAALNQEKEYFESFKQKKQAEYAELEALKNSESSITQEKHAEGLLGRMIALSELSDEYTHVFWATWLLRLLFIVLETLPLVIKLTSDRNGGQYYQVLSKNEEIHLQMLDKTKDEQLKVVEMQRNLSLTRQQLELDTQRMQLVTNSQVQHLKFYNERLQHVISMHLDYKNEAFERIKDPNLLGQILGEIDTIFQGYINTLEFLISKSVSYHKS